MKKLAPDASVLVEYIVLRSPYRSRVAEILEGAARGEVELYVSSVTLSEAFYVASRIYRAAGVEDPNGEALDFIEWLKARARVVAVDEEVALRAGELKKRLRIALPDCLVIATAEAAGATPLFKRVEREMRPILGELRRLGVRFLEEDRP